MELKSAKMAVVALGLAALLAGCEEKSGRKVDSLCGEWEFVKDPSAKLDIADAAFASAKWETVEVPHDWAIEGPFNPEGEDFQTFPRVAGKPSY